MSTPIGVSQIEEPGPPRPTMRPWIAGAATQTVLVSLYVMGLVHWWYFFNTGHVPEETHCWRSSDWPKEFNYYAVLEQALAERRVPYHMSKYVHENYTNRFLGLPETVLSPQILLLPTFTKYRIGKFIVFNTWVMYSLGFLGCSTIRRRYQLGLVSFTALFLLFNFNGYITSHLGAGHSMWNGYFLLPFFCLFLLELIEGQNRNLSSLKLAMTLFGMILQGSFHMMIWCWIFLLLFVLFNRHYWKDILLVIGFSGALSTFRLLPAMITFWEFKNYTFLSGYPTLADLLDGFIVVRDFQYPYTGNIFGYPMAWWEFDVYIGILGLTFLIYFGAYKRFGSEPYLQAWRYPALDMPLALMVVLSLSYFYAFISKLPLPLFNGERVSTRFIIIPVVMVLVLAAIRIQRTFEAKPPNLNTHVLIGAAILQMFFALAWHSYLWQVGRIETLWKNIYWKDPPPDINIQIIDGDEWAYVATVQVSALVSLIVLVAWLYMFWRWRPTKDGGSPPLDPVIASA